MATEMSSEVVFSGILYKCGNKVKTWKKRWMALKDDCCLYYYKDVTMSRKPQGIVSLRCVPNSRLTLTYCGVFVMTTS